MRIYNWLSSQGIGLVLVGCTFTQSGRAPVEVTGNGSLDERLERAEAVAKALITDQIGKQIQQEIPGVTEEDVSQLTLRVGRTLMKDDEVSIECRLTTGATNEHFQSILDLCKHKVEKALSPLGAGRQLGGGCSLTGSPASICFQVYDAQPAAVKNWCPSQSGRFGFGPSQYLDNGCPGGESQRCDVPGGGHDSAPPPALTVAYMYDTSFNCSDVGWFYPEGSIHGP